MCQMGRSGHHRRSRALEEDERGRPYHGRLTWSVHLGTYRLLSPDPCSSPADPVDGLARVIVPVGRLDLASEERWPVWIQVRWGPRSSLLQHVVFRRRDR